MNTKPASPEEALAHFSTMISSYEHRIGHTCRNIAGQIADLLQARIACSSSSLTQTNTLTPLTVLDNACGTGAATQELLRVFPSARIFAADIVPGMVSALRALVASSPSLSVNVVSVDLEDAQTLACYKDSQFDISITNQGIFFFPDPVQGARQIHRTLKSGGIAAVSVWKSLGFQPILFEVQDRIKPVDPLLELSLNAPWFSPEKLRGVMQEGGFTEIKFHTAESAIWGKDKEDLKTVLVENCGAMVSRNWNDEEKRKLGPVLSEVIDEMQDVFCIREEERLGCRMEAWVAICTK